MLMGVFVAILHSRTDLALIFHRAIAWYRIQQDGAIPRPL